jgi:hypothetical protein
MACRAKHQDRHVHTWQQTLFDGSATPQDCANNQVMMPYPQASEGPLCLCLGCIQILHASACRQLLYCGGGCCSVVRLTEQGSGGSSAAVMWSPALTAYEGFDTTALLITMRPALMLAEILALLASGSCPARYASKRTLPYTAQHSAARSSTERYHTCWGVCEHTLTKLQAALVSFHTNTLLVLCLHFMCKLHWQPALHMSALS